MYGFKISTKMAAMSHLSDAQELLRMNRMDECNLHINFAKRIICEYPNDTEVSEETLDKLWDETVAKFGKR